MLRKVFGTGDKGVAVKSAGCQKPSFARVTMRCSLTTGTTGTAPLGRGGAPGLTEVVEPPGLAASRRGRRAAPVEGDAPPGDPVQVQVMRLLEWPGCEGRSQAELSGPHVAVRRRRREPQWQCSGGVGGHTWQCGGERSRSRTWRCGGRRCRATGRTALGEQRARASGRAVLGEQWARASTAGWCTCNHRGGVTVQQEPAQSQCYPETRNPQRRQAGSGTQRMERTRRKHDER